MQKHTLTQNKLEKASVLQHCYPEFDLGEERQRAAWAASYTKASTELTSERLTLFLSVQNSLYTFTDARHNPINNRSRVAAKVT
jgi:hypothetical protein